MMALAIYKDLLGQMDIYHRQGLDHPDWIADAMDPLWEELTPDEQDQARAHVYVLRRGWTPQEQYDDAVRVLAAIPRDNAPNDVTTPEARASQRAFWAARRDAALAHIRSETPNGPPA